MYARTKRNRGRFSKRSTTLKESTSPKDNVNKQKLPDALEYIENRDYTGAIGVLEYYQKSGKAPPNIKEDVRFWIAYCCFHLGNYERAYDIYEEIKEKTSKDEEKKLADLYMACCLFHMSEYEQCKEHGVNGTDNPLRNRLLFHVSDKLHQEPEVMKYHANILDTVEDQMSLAAMHFLRTHIKEATDIYKRINAKYKNYLALNVYIALCYYKLYEDMSQHVSEVIDNYLRQYPDSAMAMNLKACNHAKSFSGQTAIQILQPILDLQTSTGHENLLIKHNMVVFKEGEGALQVLPDLVDLNITEARLNLVIHHLQNDKVEEAMELMEPIEPTNIPQYTLKAVVNATLGQKIDSREHIKRSKQFYQLVGGSQTDRDTIPGRQCMASSLFLQKNFTEVEVYLESIREFFVHDDKFNWNYGISLASRGKYKKAENILLMVQNPKFRQDYIYIAHLCRCYIMNGKAGSAWDIYLQMDTNDYMRDIVQLIADDCYRVGAFFFAAKAFDVLERLEPSQEYWEGKRGACIGAFQLIIAAKESKERLHDIINILKNSHNDEVDYIIPVMQNWAQENNVEI